MNFLNDSTVRTFPAVLGFGAGLATVQGVFDYTGGKFSGYEKDPHVDEYERKENLRKMRRKPIQETLEQLGEGRGILKFVITITGRMADVFGFRNLRSRL